MPSIDKAVENALKIAADDSHGYDQEERLGNPDFDCSSFVSRCLKDAGFKVAADSWTGNLYEQLIKCGFKNIQDKSIKAGDIFLTPNRHVVIAVSPTKIAHASLNEKGGITGGKPGDQTGKEICVRSFYTPSYGWKYHLRYTPEDEEKEPETEDTDFYRAPKLIEDIIDGRYGVWPEREEKIKALGLDYPTVQFLVNETIKENEGK